MSNQFVGYFRVSTERQGRSGLGLEAQRDAVLRHLAGVGGRLQGEFVEIESGKRNDRPQLAAAIAATKKAKATLVIAKLDRLARNVHFVSGLMESGVDFIAADNPHEDHHETNATNSATKSMRYGGYTRMGAARIWLRTAVEIVY